MKNSLRMSVALILTMQIAITTEKAYAIDYWAWGYGQWLRNTGDQNHGYIYSSSIDGPEFRGYGGFVWKTGYQGATERMRLTTTGLGIGNTNPGYLLDVSGRARFRNGTSGTAGVFLMNSSNTVNQGFIGLTNDTTVGMWGNSAGWGMVMNINSGNVGIGTTVPNNKLHVVGNAKFQGLTLFTQNPTDTNAVSCAKLLNAHNTVGDKWYLGFSTGSDGNNANDIVRLQAQTVTNGGVFTILTSTNGVVSEKLRVDNNGRVGIGTSNATEMLTVNGNIKATALITDVSKFPDYVFEPSYELKSLSQIKDYIAANKRLPGMPSEQEVVTEGMDLGKVAVLSVEKLEELYLHIIKLNDRIMALQQKLQEAQAAKELKH